MSQRISSMLKDSQECSYPIKNESKISENLQIGLFSRELKSSPKRPSEGSVVTSGVSIISRIPESSQISPFRDLSSIYPKNGKKWLQDVENDSGKYAGHQGESSNLNLSHFGRSLEASDWSGLIRLKLKKMIFTPNNSGNESRGIIEGIEEHQKAQGDDTRQDFLLFCRKNSEISKSGPTFKIASNLEFDRNEEAMMFKHDEIEVKTQNRPQMKQETLKNQNQPNEEKSNFEVILTPQKSIQSPLKDETPPVCSKSLPKRCQFLNPEDIIYPKKHKYKTPEKAGKRALTEPSFPSSQNSRSALQKAEENHPDYADSLDKPIEDSSCSWLGLITEKLMEVCKPGPPSKNISQKEENEKFKKVEKSKNFKKFENFEKLKNFENFQKVKKSENSIQRENDNNKKIFIHKQPIQTKSSKKRIFGQRKKSKSCEKQIKRVGKQQVLLKYSNRATPRTNTLKTASNQTDQKSEDLSSQRDSRCQIRVNSQFKSLNASKPSSKTGQSSPETLSTLISAKRTNQAVNSKREVKESDLVVNLHPRSSLSSPEQLNRAVFDSAVHSDSQKNLRIFEPKNQFSSFPVNSATDRWQITSPRTPQRTKSGLKTMIEAKNSNSIFDQNRGQKSLKEKSNASKVSKASKRAQKKARINSKPFKRAKIKQLRKHGSPPSISRGSKLKRSTMLSLSPRAFPRWSAISKTKNPSLKNPNFKKNKRKQKLGKKATNVAPRAMVDDGYSRKTLFNSPRPIPGQRNPKNLSLAITSPRRNLARMKPKNNQEGFRKKLKANYLTGTRPSYQHKATKSFNRSTKAQSKERDLEANNSIKDRSGKGGVKLSEYLKDFKNQKHQFGGIKQVEGFGFSSPGMSRFLSLRSSPGHQMRKNRISSLLESRNHRLRGLAKGGGKGAGMARRRCVLSMTASESPDESNLT